MRINLLLYAVSVWLCFSVVNSFSAPVEQNNNDLSNDKIVNTNNIEIGEDEVVVMVNGIVCSFCSQGVARKLSKLGFLDHSKYTKGVKVEIEVQKVTIALKPDSDFNINEVFKSIKSGGYEPVVAYRKQENEIITIYPEE